MVAVAVTEPDYGSDVAGIKVAPPPVAGGWIVINGVKTWCTFAGPADVLMLLARTDPDRSKAHRACRCSSCPSRAATATASSSPGGTARREDGGPRHRHHRLPRHALLRGRLRRLVRAGENLVGGEDGLGKGFYFQMAGFENGRLQTAPAPSA